MVRSRYFNCVKSIRDRGWLAEEDAEEQGQKRVLLLHARLEEPHGGEGPQFSRWNQGRPAGSGLQRGVAGKRLLKGHVVVVPADLILSIFPVKLTSNAE